jgi:hypothetical protein
MTKSQKKILSRLKKEIKNFFPIPEEGDKVYSFIKKVEQIIIQEEAESKERKRKQENEELRCIQFSFDDYECKWEYQADANEKNKESGDFPWDELK